MRYYEFGYDKEEGGRVYTYRAIACRAPLAFFVRTFTRPDEEIEIDEKTFRLHREFGREFRREVRRIRRRQTWQIIQLMVRR